MTTDILQSEAERCLSFIFEHFSHSRRSAQFPLTDIAACKALSNSVTEVVTQLRATESRLPPTALILAMIRVCKAVIDPPSAEYAISSAKLGIPRPFAYEVLDRLRAELPATMDFAMDQIGRIVNEAGNLTHDEKVRHAFQAHRARHSGALCSAELDALVAHIWNNRYPHYAHLGVAAPERKAA